MKFWICTATCLMTLGIGSVWATEALTPQQIVDDRIAGMKSLGGNMKAIQSTQDAALIRQELQKALTFAQSIPGKFPKGTGVGDAGITKTRALQNIWLKPDEFKTATNALASAIQAASAVAGDQDKLGLALGGIKKSCGGCHEQFRGPEPQ